MNAITITAKPPLDPSSTDRLSLALFIAAALHGVFILGVGFTAVDQISKTPPSLDVILVPPLNTETPPKADYLAQTSQDGSQHALQESFQAPLQTHWLPSTGDFSTEQFANHEGTQSIQDNNQLLTQRRAEIAVQNSQDISQNGASENGNHPQPTPQDFAIEQLSAEAYASFRQYAQLPKKKFITARTQEAVAAHYMYNWVEKIERIGNLNYPDSARRQKLSGSLVLVVGINKNGGVREIILHRSSGYQILDDAAKNIVRLAAPFDPITGELADETDVLYITRTWEFSNNQSLRTH